MRVFIAINFPTPVRRALVKHQQTIRNAAQSGNFTHEENLHLTLVFLGEVPVGDLSRINAIVDTVVCPPFPLAFDEIGRFDRKGKDIWWVGIRRSRNLLDLQAALDDAFRRAGYRLDSRPFTAHITLAREVRMSDPGDRRHLCAAIAPIETMATRVSVMVSTRIGGRLNYREVYGKDFPT
ncbi:MAG: RNA 2',3'-cyclic phosphodiesterase [Spirochaetae bacterium HGW-Spirochaetae-2]|jgi:2'-5' RNA ligase|nr:MAG: RNA 2',3'-cyclic phosphodiesterase [Spirochaetae bacterium HGW-Spirochaetae-2]